MSNKIINKMMGAIGLIDDEEEVDEAEKKEEIEYEEDIAEPEIVNRRNKIVSIKTNSTPKVLLKKPVEFQDVQEIINAVKARKIVVMNMIDTDPQMAQRMLDNISGACYALNGSLERVAKSIYLVAPDNVEIDNELKQELNRSGFFSFEDR